VIVALDIRAEPGKERRVLGLDVSDGEIRGILAREVFSAAITFGCVQISGKSWRAGPTPNIIPL
jgi:hypothetical protein